MVFIFALLSSFCSADDLDQAGMASLVEGVNNCSSKVAHAGKGPTCPEYHGAPMVMKEAAPLKANYQTQSVMSTGKVVFPVSVVPEADLTKVYKNISGMGLPWDNPTFCRDRALVMASYFNQAGIKVGQVMTEPTMGNEIYPNFKDRANPPWKYHQAVFIMVKKANGSVEKQVIDPSTFDHVVPLAEWQAFQTNLGTTNFGGPTALNSAEARSPNPPPLDITVSGNQALCRIKHYKDGTPCR